MPNINEFLSKFSDKDWCSFEAPITPQNENSPAMPWILQSFANMTCEILKEYTNWLTENYDLKPKM